ncbi:MAG: zf-HC2 domain-containing protein [Acidimicrobiales bacterium]
MHRLLQTHIDGELDEVSARLVVRHLEECRRCGLEASIYAEIKTVLARQSAHLDQETVRRLQAFVASLEQER